MIHDKKTMNRIILVIGFLILGGITLLIGMQSLIGDSQDNFVTEISQKLESVQLTQTNENHWDHMPITYEFTENCIGPIIPRIEKSFDEIESNTNSLITFQEINNDADITFICYNKPYAESGAEGPDGAVTYFTLGLANYSLNGNIIENATIEFWGVDENSRPNSCWNYPRLELHEILHVFGIEHINDPYSIMYPWEDGCVARDDIITRAGKTFKPEDKLDEDIIGRLKDIYNK